MKFVFYLSFWVKIEFPFSASLETANGNEMAIHSSIPTWKSLWTEEPGGYRSRKELDMTEHKQAKQMRIMFVYLFRS